jgi:hypothetical protein
MAKKEIRIKVKDRNRKIVIGYKSEGCIICGYKKCLNALHFHHTKEKDKKLKGSFAGNAIQSWRADRLISELEKCIVVCANCHIEIHSGLHPQYDKESNIDIKLKTKNIQMSFLDEMD